MQQKLADFEQDYYYYYYFFSGHYFFFASVAALRPLTNFITPNKIQNQNQGSEWEPLFLNPLVLIRSCYTWQPPGSPLDPLTAYSDWIPPSGSWPGYLGWIAYPKPPPTASLLLLLPGLKVSRSGNLEISQNSSHHPLRPILSSPPIIPIIPFPQTAPISFLVCRTLGQLAFSSSSLASFPFSLVLCVAPLTEDVLFSSFNS